MPSAHLPPSSRRTEAMAATQGVYSRQNTSSGTAVPSVSSEVIPSPTSTIRVETTLSLAMKPVISAVEMRQSPKPRGLKMGAI